MEFNQSCILSLHFQCSFEIECGSDNALKNWKFIFQIQLALLQYSIFQHFSAYCYMISICSQYFWIQLMSRFQSYAFKSLKKISIGLKSVKGNFLPLSYIWCYHDFLLHIRSRYVAEDSCCLISSIDPPLYQSRNLNGSHRCSHNICNPTILKL